MAANPRVRFAPSPTGYLHVGGARTALFNWFFARQQGGVFLLRIEDTDRQRSSDEMTEAILDGMRWLGLDWDEGPFHQADGVERHRADAARLLDDGHAYRCFCSPEELQARREAADAGASSAAYRYDRRCYPLPAAEGDRRATAGEPFTVRFRVPEGATEWDDLVHGPIRFANAEIEDFIILRTDGTPVYNLAAVSDDAAMAITHVIRGDDHLSNTPKQLMLYRALGAALPRFAHLPMILGPDGKRLSKRHGATAVGEYRERGILPEALMNFLALLGWNPGDDQEVMRPAELLARFSLERVHRKSAVFDSEKLEWMNGQHMLLTPAPELLRLITPDLIGAGLATPVDLEDRADWFAGLVELLRPRARTLRALAEQARPYLAPEIDYHPAAIDKHWKDPPEVAARLEEALRSLEQLPEWSPEAVETALRGAAERLGIGFGKVVHPLRVALVGSAVSPGIDEVVVRLGPELTRSRIEAARRLLLGEPSDDSIDTCRTGS